MKLTVRYFASLREALGAQEHWDSVPEGLDAQGLRVWLCGRSSAHAAALAEGRAVRCAINHTMVEAAAPVPDGAEVAFFPPVTGG